MVKMKVLVMRMMVMMIPMKSGATMMIMAMISPLQEGISPADFCLPAGTELPYGHWGQLTPIKTSKSFTN
jgi:hypothetical protein